MKILIISTNDLRGGAAKCAYNLAHEFKDLGHQVRMYVGEKRAKENWIIKSKTPKLIKALNHLRDRLLPILLTRDKYVPFTMGTTGEKLDRIIEDFKPDIINFHWTGKGFVSFKEMLRAARRFPTVITLHDSSLFTGGYFLGVNSIDNRWLEKVARFNLNAKRRQMRDTKLNIVTPSNFLMKQAKKSELIKTAAVTVINNGIDLEIFKQADKKKVRKKLGLDQNQKYILFGAGDIVKDRAKGFDLLVKTLLAQKDYLERSKIGLISFGSSDPFAHYLKELNIPKIHIGYVESAKKMTEIYSAADLFLFPSKTENYPFSIIESIVCKTPVIAFNVGGVPEIISTDQFGILTEPFNTEQMGKNMIKLLNRRENRIKVPVRFGLSSQAEKYLHLFSRLLAVKA